MDYVRPKEMRDGLNTLSGDCHAKSAYLAVWKWSNQKFRSKYWRSHLPFDRIWLSNWDRMKQKKKNLLKRI